ncbi:DUF962 domain-containing protein [Deltaproteobacteria bacterium PRO3]|nr:DUF962 domain-containing protein [Deltaproteobacteria bacterium PRO3]
MTVQDLIENYKRSHTHPFNHAMHAIGIPMILVSLAWIFFDWKVGLILFGVGWAFQFLGHAVEGKPPAFFSNPAYLLIGPIWLAKKLGGLFSKPKPADTDWKARG